MKLEVTDGPFREWRTAFTEAHKQAASGKRRGHRNYKRWVRANRRGSGWVVAKMMTR